MEFTSCKVGLFKTDFMEEGTTDLQPSMESLSPSHITGTTEGVMSTTDVSVSSGTSSEDNLPLWVNIFNFMGFLANVLTIISLYINHTGFNRLVLILLRHQSFMDSIVCLLASIIVFQPFMWTTGLNWFDVFICHAWHGQALYWGAVTISTYNLVYIAIERLLSVVKPLQYPAIVAVSKKKLAALFLLLYIGTLFITHGVYLQTKMKEGECLHGYFKDGKAVERYYFGFVIFTYVITYFIPALGMAIIYGLVAFTLRRRNKNMSLGHSNLIEKAGSHFTKTAMVVTVIFIITVGYDLHYYLLGYTGITTYQLNKPVQKIGIFLANLNSCVNPFIYALCMPQFRQNLLNSCRQCLRLKPKLLNSTRVQSARDLNLTTTMDASREGINYI